MDINARSSLPTKLLWVDLEMTGLDPLSDLILEVALEVTDFNFNSLATYASGISQPREVVEMRLGQNPWWQNYPEARDNILTGMATGKPSYVVEREIVDIIQTHFGDEPAILAGNSIHNDRNFIKHWWPAVDSKLHYRMLDVSSWKIWMQGAQGYSYPKPEVHRAEDDIQASIAELKNYLAWFKTGNGSITDDTRSN